MNLLTLKMPGGLGHLAPCCRMNWGCVSLSSVLGASLTSVGSRPLSSPPLCIKLDVYQTPQFTDLTYGMLHVELVHHHRYPSLFATLMLIKIELRRAVRLLALLLLGKSRQSYKEQKQSWHLLNT